MDKFIDKISSYNLLNNLLPGAVYIFLINILFGVNILENNLIENLFVYYFIGMVISRVGSVVIEPLCIRMRIVVYADYGDYLKASLKDNKIDILTETNNTYRTILSLCVMLMVSKIYLVLSKKILWFSSNSSFVIIVALLILFLLSYRKQTSYIKKRVLKVNEREK